MGPTCLQGASALSCPFVVFVRKSFSALRAPMRRIRTLFNVKKNSNKQELEHGHTSGMSMSTPALQTPKRVVASCCLVVIHVLCGTDTSIVYGIWIYDTSRHQQRYLGIWLLLLLHTNTYCSSVQQQQYYFVAVWSWCPATAAQPQSHNNSNIDTILMAAAAGGSSLLLWYRAGMYRDVQTPVVVFLTGMSAPLVAKLS